MNCITNPIWRRLSMRLKQEVKVSLKNEISHKYIAFLPFTKDNEFNGIINYLKMKSDDNIDNEISLTFSTNDHENKNDNWTDIHNILLYNDQSKGFFTKNYEDIWICFDFKDKTIIPTDYTVKTDVGQFLKSWFIEVSKIVDEKNNRDELNGCYRVHTYKLNKPNSKPVRYIRIRQTESWISCHLGINAFEIFGNLIYK